VLRLGAKFLTTFICLGLFSFNAQSRTFKNAYISFEMQDNWKCNLEQTEWVCRAEDPQEAKEAVIILTAKEKGPTVSFPLYETHLNSPINTVTRNGVAMTSTVKYKAVSVKINDQPWLDGLHQDSEVPNYFTRYMATIKDQIAILVTFSAHNKLYAKHSGNFEKTIRTLRVIATKDLLNRPDLGPLRGSGELLGPGSVGSAAPSDLLADAVDNGSAGGKKGLFSNKTALGIGLLVLAVLIFVISKVMGKK
jgi:hypothetical protein